jgi:predicted transcriptional regulator
MSSRTDIILPIRDPYMTQIVQGVKNYEFRKYRLKASIRRIWFYRTAPHSSLTHICEILPARTRQAGDSPLLENGLENAEFNARHPDWEGYDYAYEILSVWELRELIPFAVMRDKFGFRSAPRGLVYLPKRIRDCVVWNKQKKALDNRGNK